MSWDNQAGASGGHWEGENSGGGAVPFDSFAGAETYGSGDGFQGGENGDYQGGGGFSGVCYNCGQEG
jgi:hypothetical protein